MNGDLAVAWYGERGIINALVTELAARPEASCAAQELLRAIRWADAQEPNWISKVTSAVYIVETALAEFGSPDLILVARCANQELPYVVFVEGKVKPYAFSAIPNRIGMTEPAFNSSINGQLALRYRLSEALNGWDGERPQIAEPRFLWTAYMRASGDGGLSDPCQHPRHVQKPAVLDLLRRYHVHGLPCDHYYFVALTGDSDPFWDQEHVVTADLLPLLLNPLPDGDCCWGEMRGRLGCLTYEAIDERLRPGPAYQEALATMECAVHESELPAGRRQTGVSVVFVPSLSPPETEHTAVHFSWSGNNAVIRIYGDNDLPTELTCATLDVLRRIDRNCERSFNRRNRPRYTDSGAWRVIIEQINQEWNIG